MVVVRVDGLSKHYGPVCAVRDLSFRVEQGCCFGLLGPNGAGKSSVMRMLYGRSLPDPDCRMAIEVLGHNPFNDPLAIKYASGVVPQENNLDDELDVTANLMVYARFYGLTRRLALARIQRLLAFMELADKARVGIKQLSGGMQRRLVIARALLNEPRLLLLDEPTTGLDVQVRHLIWARLRELRTQGTTVILSTHYMEEAAALCDQVMIMDKGRKVLEGPPAELVRQNIELYCLETAQPNDDTWKDDGLPRSVRLDRRDDGLRFYSNNPDDLRSVAGMLGGVAYTLRQANLEDVFIKATGTRLDGN